MLTDVRPESAYRSLRRPIVLPLGKRQLAVVTRSCYGNPRHLRVAGARRCYHLTIPKQITGYCEIYDITCIPDRYLSCLRRRCPSLNSAK
jgi:hypothetical protein